MSLTEAGIGHKDGERGQVCMGVRSVHICAGQRTVQKRKRGCTELYRKGEMRVRVQLCEGRPGTVFLEGQYTQDPALVQAVRELDTM